MSINHNPYSLFPVKEGDRFTGLFFKGIATVRHIENGRATLDFEDPEEQNRNGESSYVDQMEQEMRTYELQRLTTFQFRRKPLDTWEEMAEHYEWAFVEQFLPDYDTREEVKTSYDFSDAVTGEKTLEWFYEKYPRWNGIPITGLKEIYYQWDYELEMEAQATLVAAIQSGEIEVREIPIYITSARIIIEGESESVWLRCADTSQENYGNEFHVSASQLQRVDSRVLNPDTDDEQFQIYYVESNFIYYWCNANRIDFENLE